jgi:hypothetical protein
MRTEQADHVVELVVFGLREGVKRDQFLDTVGGGVGLGPPSPMQLGPRCEAATLFAARIPPVGVPVPRLVAVRTAGPVQLAHTSQLSADEPAGTPAARPHTAVAEPIWDPRAASTVPRRTGHPSPAGEPCRLRSATLWQWMPKPPCAMLTVGSSTTADGRHQTMTR